MTLGVAGLTFIGLIVGILLALGFMSSQHETHKTKLVENDNVAVPEWHLGSALLGCSSSRNGCLLVSKTNLRSTWHRHIPALGLAALALHLVLIG